MLVGAAPEIVLNVEDVPNTILVKERQLVLLLLQLPEKPLGSRSVIAAVTFHVDVSLSVLVKSSFPRSSALG